MRIALFIKKTTYHKGFGGLETMNKVLCEGLAERGYEITVYSPKYELSFNQKHENGVDYIFVDCVFKSIFSNFISNHWYNKSWEFFLKSHSKIPYDLIVSQSSAGIGILKKIKQVDLPVLSISHGSSLMEFKTLLRNIYSFNDLIYLLKNLAYFLFNILVKQKYFIHNSKIVVAVSSYVAKTLKFETGESIKKFRIINNAIKVPQNISQSNQITQKNNLNESNLNIKPLNITNTHINPKQNDLKIALSKSNEVFLNENSDQKIKLLYVGQILKSKGVDTLIKIIQDQRFNNVHIDVIGSGNYFNKFKQKIMKLGLSNRFTLHGNVNYKDVYTFYKNSYLLLFPTNRYEGFPMVIVEAMFNFLPIVSYNIGGVSDAINNNITGYLVNPLDINNFKNRLLNLINDVSLRNKMSLKAYDKALNEFNLETMISKYDFLFKELVNENM